MKKFLHEFKEFALKGNVMNLAVGVIIGSAFQGIVKSLTQDILSPVLGLFARQNFDNMELDFLGVSLKYGAFMTTVINFIIMAFVVFCLVRVMAKLLSFGEKKDDSSKKSCPHCCTEIDIKASRCPACTSYLA